jgi:hypothetical protein
MTEQTRSRLGWVLVGILHPIFVIAPLVGFAVWLLPSSDREDHPIPVFRKHELDIRDYAEKVRQGQVESRTGGWGGYPMPRWLVDNGAKHTYLEEGCVVITFFFMPTGAIPELRYSPMGFDPFPKALEERKNRAFFRWQQIAADWGVCWWDP